MIEILKYSEACKKDIFKRSQKDGDVSETVSSIIRDVKENKDSALFKYCEKFDKAHLSSLEVTLAEIEEAVMQVDKKFIGILEKAAANIEAFHRHQVRSGFIMNERGGIVTGQKILPLHRVGLYVPGGTAAYPSSVLMNAIPAKIAGVPEVIMTTPATGGSVNPVILAAAKIAGVDRIFKIGGAQAVAALAFGTESVPKVDKIAGPGNAYVAEAKKQVFGHVAIDMIAGPSEILVIADSSSNPKHAAADLLSQAEHDKMASAVLITDSHDFALAVSAELERQLLLLPRCETARASIETGGKIIVVKDIETAIGIANDLAPEHLELCVENPFDYLGMIHNAGSVFLGRNCPEALGDYYAGPNHTLPTSGTARFSSPLSVDDFVKKMQYTYYSKDALYDVYRDVAYFARQEGLTAHEKSITVRFED